MLKRKILVAASLLAASLTVQAQTIPDAVAAEAIKLRDQAMQDTIAYELVESLTMEVGPRPAGSAADKAAVKWAEQMLLGLGFANVRTEAVTVPHWDRGSVRADILAPVPQPLVSTSLGGSPGTAESGLQAEVIRVESLDELRALSTDDLSGRFAYVDHRMSRDKSGGGYSPASRIRSCGHYIAAERGAVGTIIRSAGTSHHRFPHTGSMLNRDIPPMIPAIALSNADADLLTHQTLSGDPVTFQLRSSARHLPPQMSANVIGEIPGHGDLAHEVVILAAHLDSWDLGTGAIDDGAGVAIVTAAAKMILDTGSAPRRTVRVVLYANEEFGLDGAEQYAEKHATAIRDHVIGLEADFGAGRVWEFSSRVAANALDLVGEIHALLEPIGIERGKNTSTGGADLSPLRKAGMPVLEMTQDGSKYFDFHHTADDTLDKIDRDDINQNVAAYVTAAYVAEYIEQDFGRIEPDTRRKRSCSAEDDEWKS
jgi:hypothetical protein